MPHLLKTEPPITDKLLQRHKGARCVMADSVSPEPKTWHKKAQLHFLLPFKGLT